MNGWTFLWISKKQILNGTRKTGYWELEVAEAGEYDFELRRWPREIDTPLTEESKMGGEALPISRARISISNKNHIAFEDKRPFIFEGLVKSVELGQTSVTFTVHLEAGPMALQTWFDDKTGETICSSYYVYIRRK